MREDYSADGTAWDYFPHDHARSRAYRWNEDGIAGICDRHQIDLLRARALERPRPDPQGAALRPDRQRRQSRRGRQGVLLLPRQHADALVHEVSLQVSAARVPVRAARRGEPPPRPRSDPEFELLDTGVFDDNRYFDVFVEYAKASPNDILIRITAVNRGPKSRTAPPAADALVPQHVVVGTRHGAAPSCADGRQRRRDHRARRTPNYGRRLAALRGHAGAALHRERDERRRALRRSTTRARSSRTASTTTSCTARTDAVNPAQRGTKAAAHYRHSSAAGRVDCRAAAPDRSRRLGRSERPRRRLRSRSSPHASAKPTSSTRR